MSNRRHLFISQVLGARELERGAVNVLKAARYGNPPGDPGLADTLRTMRAMLAVLPMPDCGNR